MGRDSAIEVRMRAVLLYKEDVRQQEDICSVYGITERTLRRWIRAYESGGMEKLMPGRPGPRHPGNSLSKSLEDRILKLKQKRPPWGARRIKFQHDLPCHWMTVHRVIKRHGMLVRVKPKPQPLKRFQRYHVGPMWQGDTF
ncbi:MAG: helix-turn-helix domain-containing protein [Nitrososphaerota archaeon]|nr:helix-turn-helix domain-containing protein [Nitrososphaerota archaeon]